jgi:hypothetical protein
MILGLNGGRGKGSRLRGRRKGEGIKRNSVEDARSMILGLSSRGRYRRESLGSKPERLLELRSTRIEIIVS